MCQGLGQRKVNIWTVVVVCHTQKFVFLAYNALPDMLARTQASLPLPNP